MILINSVSEVISHSQKDAHTAAQVTAMSQAGNDSSGTTFQDWFMHYTQKAEAEASAKTENSREAGIYMGYFLPMFYAHSPDTKPTVRNQKSDS